MPTDDHFNRYPPFPTDVPIADLRCLSFSKLLADEESESEQLYQSCREIGFFLVDLRGTSEGETMLKHAEIAFDLDKKILELDQEELTKHAFQPPASLFGYKCAGNMKLEDGSPDRMEFYNLGQDDILGTSAPRKNPQVVEDNRKTFQDFFYHAHGIICHLLKHLDKHLGLRRDTLASFSPQDKPSGTSLRLLKTLPQKFGSHRTNLVGHTDLGSMTMLFNIVGGLQILPAGAENIDANWRYIRPEPGCALINLGDAMVQWSGGILRSNMHRVATAPGQQAGCTRYSLAYLVRPASNVSMRRLAGGDIIPDPEEGEEDEDICARDWERMRAAQIVKGENKPKSTGGRMPKINPLHSSPMRKN